MNRRNFIAGILAASIAPRWLKGAGRIWKRPDRKYKYPLILDYNWVTICHGLNCKVDVLAYNPSFLVAIPFQREIDMNTVEVYFHNLGESFQVFERCG